jgi:general secretion pathway protein D
MRNLHPVLALIAFVALPMALAADTPPAKISAVAQTTGSAETRLIHVIRLEHANSHELSNELTRILPAPLTAGVPLLVVPDGDTNSLILSGPVNLLTDAEAVVQKLDVAPTGAVQTQIIRLKHARAKDLATILREVVSQKMRSSRGWAGITFDERTESLVVTGDTPALASLQTLIDSLDVETPKSTD